ncbi:hypothetical protein FB451DRAFT_1486158 [Mycena latifolia]|nr:hypothetical protein FB451DRAFT_1486158 [Mycena latifolia]
MSTLSEIHTFLKLYFGDTLSRVLDMLYRVRGRKNDAEDAVDGARDTSTDTGTSSTSASTEPLGFYDDAPVKPTAPPIDTKPDDASLLSAAAAANLTLPSLPSILTKPYARPPLAVDDSDAAPQCFGPPSNEYHDRRLPLGTVTNIPKIVNGKTRKGKTPKATSARQQPPKVVKWSLPTMARRSCAKGSCSVFVDETSPHSPVAHAASPTDTLDAVPAPVTAASTPAPGSAEWNATKTALLAQVRSWSEQVKASRRHSYPVLGFVSGNKSVLVPGTSAPTSVAALSQAVKPKHAASKRHSAPPVLVASSKAPRLDLEDLLSSLIVEAQDTIAALDGENGDGLGHKHEDAVGSKYEDAASSKFGGEVVSRYDDAVSNKSDGGAVGSKYSDSTSNQDPGVRTFSAVALESGPIFVIGDDDELEAVTTKPQHPHRDARALPTHTGDVTPTTGRVIASISASRSLAELADTSSRSLSDLLAAFDDVLAGPRWRRLLARSDSISGARRNDSIV